MIKPTQNLDILTDALKERIYATLALLAIIISIEPDHVSILKASVQIGGTALSLWFASNISAQMAHRVVHGRLMNRAEGLRVLRAHSPLLFAAVPPLVIMAAAALGIFSLATALAIAAGLSILTLLTFSLASARAMHASAGSTIVLAVVETAIGLGVVALKLFVE